MTQLPRQRAGLILPLSAQPVATDTTTLFNRQPLETSATCLFHRILHLYAWHPVKLYKPADLDTCNAMEDITAEEDGKPAVEGEKRRKLLIGITSFSILLGFIMMVMGCIMLSQYSVFLDFVTRRYTETAVFLLVIGLFTMAVSGTGNLRSDHSRPIYEAVAWATVFYSDICIQSE